jgi:SAM-dependent methyltransferase
MERYEKLVTDEICRLESLGWKNWHPDQFLVRSSEKPESQPISFPESYWEPKARNTESEGIWAQTRAKKILKVCSENEIDVIWEVGAGNGNVAIPLKMWGKGVLGVEPLRTGAEALAFNGIVSFHGTLQDLAFPDSSICAIGLFDVLEHLESPEVMLNEIKRVLKPGGLLITTVPANQFLFSDFDLSIGHFRRYSRKSLQKVLKGSGFCESKINYFFFVLVFPAFLLRTIPYKLGRKREYRQTIASNNRLSRLMKFVNPLLQLSFKCEDFFPIPMGLSLMSVSFKPKQ